MKAMSPHTHLAGLLALTFVLAGCEHKAPPPPILSVPATKECTTTVSTGGAAALPFDADDVTAIDLVIDEGSLCYKTPDGSKSLYAVVALPQPGYEYILAVESYVKGSSLFPPRLLLLDKSGKVLREFNRNRFQFRANILTGLMRVHKGDTYLVIGTDPVEVGKSESQVRGQTYESQGSIVYGPAGTIAAFIPPMAFSGEVERSFTYSYGGRIKVVARPMPKAK